MKKKPKLTENAYVVKTQNLGFVLSTVCLLREDANFFKKEWPKSKVVKVKIIEQ